MKRKILVCLLVFCTVCVWATNDMPQTKNIRYELTYGDWQGATTKHLPTMVRSFFYDEDGLLKSTLDARYQLGDSETTLEVEKEGEMKPETYTTYIYNEHKLLTNVVEQKYKAVHGYYYGWDKARVVQMFEYDEQQHLIFKKTAKEGSFTYVWKGDTLVSETSVTEKGDWNHTKTYYDFLEDAITCARRVVQAGKYQNFIIENEYDALHRKVKSTHYHLVDAVKNADGMIVDGAKGKTYMQETWTYEGDLMTCYQSGYWNSGKEMYEPATKQELVYDENEGGVVVKTYTYSNGNWYHFGSDKVSIEATYHQQTLSEGVTIVPVANATTSPNTLRISFKAQEVAEDIVAWGVYRNGCRLGEAVKEGGEMVFVDHHVPNGTWEYIVKAETGNEEEDYYVSEGLTYLLDTKLPPVTDISCIESGLTYVENNPVYAYNLVWNTPETDYELLGYLVYLNPDENNEFPTSHNVEMLREPRYRLWETDFAQTQNTFVIEAIYNIGTVKSAPITFDLDKSHVMASGSRVNKSTRRVYGDMVGGTASSQPQKTTSYYYDNDNNVVCAIETGCLTGDDPDTEEVEVAGTVVPISYTQYEYDMFGNLMEVRSRAYGMYSGYDMVWSDEWVTEETYAYDDMTGKLAEQVKAGKKYTYQWEGERKVQECGYSMNGDWLYAMEYSNFNEQNQPKYAFSVSKHPTIQTYNRIYEFDYDEQGNLVAKREYKFGTNVKKDGEGNVVSADKGVLNVEETWTYRAGRLVEYLQCRYNSMDKALKPYSKREYVETATGLREIAYSYSSIVGEGIWTKSSVMHEESTSEYYAMTAPRNLKISEVDGMLNTIKLTCDAPQRVHVPEVVYEVFRNGQKIGETTPNEDGKISYVDEMVPNGVWNYFVRVASAYDGIDFYVTPIVEHTFKANLPAVTKVDFPVNGSTADGSLTLEVVWEKPQTDLEILGYNIFTDIKEFTKNPSPDNDLVMIQPDVFHYTYVWSSLMSMEKTVCIETVYRIGKAKSEYFPVTISKIPVGISEVDATHSWRLEDDVLKLNVRENKVLLYDVKGCLQGSYSNVDEVRIDNLQPGIYLFRIETASGTAVLKFVR